MGKVGKLLSKLHPSRDAMLKNFMHKIGLPPEFNAKLKEESVTNHVVIFLLPNWQKWYEDFEAELKARKVSFMEQSTFWRPKYQLPVQLQVIAVIVPKVLLTGEQIREIGLKIGMITK